MIEIYLFIHPLCSDSYRAEKEFLALVTKETKKIQFKVIPILNLASFQKFITDNQLDSLSLQRKNQLFDLSYEVILDYKAIQLQGKKRARLFLLSLQQALCDQDIRYSPTLVAQLVKKAGGNLATFRSDRNSKLVEQFFKEDQITAREMGVTTQTSVVIYNYECDENFGILLEDNPPVKLVHDLITEKPVDKQRHYQLIRPILSPTGAKGSNFRLFTH